MSTEERPSLAVVRAGVVAMIQNKHVGRVGWMSRELVFKGNYSALCDMVEEIYTVMRKEITDAVDSKNQGRA